MFFAVNPYPAQSVRRTPFAVGDIVTRDGEHKFVIKTIRELSPTRATVVIEQLDTIKPKPLLRTAEYGPRKGWIVKNIPAMDPTTALMNMLNTES